MEPVRKVNRRSFLARVAGGAVAAGGAFAAIAPSQAQTGITDRDPSDRVGYGRGGGTGITDADSGPGADPAGRGRGASGPPRGVGEYTGVTDSDGGANADPPQRGRGRQFGADVNQARQRQLQECQAARVQVQQIDLDVSRRTQLIRELEVTRNFIAGDIRQTREAYGDNAYQSIRMQEYQRRASQYGVSTFYGQQPEALVGAFDARIQQEQQALVYLGQQRTQIVTAMAQYNCQ